MKPPRVVADFVNTAVLGTGAREAFATARGLRRWLVSRRLLGPGEAVTQADLRDAVRTREALRALLFSRHGRADPDALALLNRTARKAGLAPRLLGPERASLAPAVGGVRGALGRILGALLGSMLDGSWRHLRACLNPTCRMAFVDASRNHSRRWCEMAVCGNRLKARRHRRRRRVAPETP